MNISKLINVLKMTMFMLVCHCVGCNEPDDSRRKPPGSADNGIGKTDRKGTEIVIHSLQDKTQEVRIITYGEIVFSPDSTLYVDLNGADTSNLKQMTKFWAEREETVSVMIGEVVVGPLLIREEISGDALVLGLSDPDAIAADFRARSIEYHGTVGKKTVPISDSVDEALEALLPPVSK